VVQQKEKKSNAILRNNLNNPLRNWYGLGFYWSRLCKN